MLATEARRGMCWEEAGPPGKEDVAREGKVVPQETPTLTPLCLVPLDTASSAWLGSQVRPGSASSCPQAVQRRGWLPSRLLGDSAFSHLLPQQVWSCEAAELPLVEATQLTPALGHEATSAHGGQEFSG